LYWGGGREKGNLAGVLGGGRVKEKRKLVLCHNTDGTKKGKTRRVEELQKQGGELEKGGD